MQNSLCLRADSNCTARDEVSLFGHDEISAKASTTASCKLEKTLTLSCRSTHLVAYTWTSFWDPDAGKTSTIALRKTFCRFGVLKKL